MDFTDYFIIFNSIFSSIEFYFFYLKTINPHFSFISVSVNMLLLEPQYLFNLIIKNNKKKGDKKLHNIKIMKLLLIWRL